MTIKSKIDFQIDSSEMKALNSIFQKYRKAVDEQGTTAKTLSDKFGAFSKSTELWYNSSKSLTENITGLLKSYKPLNFAIMNSSSLFKNLSNSTGAIATNLEKLQKSMFGRIGDFIQVAGIGFLGPIGLVVGLVSSVITGIVGAALFGAKYFANLPSNVSVMRQSALSYGTNYGSLASLDLNYSRYGDTRQFIGGVAAGRYDVTSPQYASFFSTGVNSNPSNTMDSAIELLKRIPEIINSSSSEGNTTSIANAYGLTQFWSIKEILAYAHASSDERKKQLENMSSDSKTLNLSNDSQIKWSNFNITLQRLGIRIETALADKLVGLTDPLSKLSKNITSIIGIMLENKNVKEWIKEAESGVNRFVNYLGSEEFKKIRKKFIVGLQRVAPVISIIATASLKIIGVIGKTIWFAIADGRAKSIWDVVGYSLSISHGILGPEMGKLRAMSSRSPTPMLNSRGYRLNDYGELHRNNLKNTGFAMSIAIDQLRKEGVPENNLRAAASYLVGQAIAESNLDPKASHDKGTGYGIYGARLVRWTKMTNWINSQKGDPDSLEWQMRQMAHSAMTEYPITRNELMNADPNNMHVDTVTSNFESPSVINNRAPQTAQAYKIGPGPSVSDNTSVTPNISFIPNSNSNLYGVGDSIARRVQEWGKIGGIGVDGLSPEKIQFLIEGMPAGYFKGKHIILSGGASNNISQTNLTAKQIELLYSKGASSVTLIGVGPLPRLHPGETNKLLRDIAEGSKAKGENTDFLTLPPEDYESTGDMPWVHPNRQGVSHILQHFQGIGDPQSVKVINNSDSTILSPGKHN